jgi:polyphenol oxidase
MMEDASKMLIKPQIFKPFEGLSAGQSTRHGGVSLAPYFTLNLGKNTGDSPENVAENRRRFAAALGFDANQLAWSRQVHGDAIKLVTEPGGDEGYDALVTNVPGILLTVSVADCGAILIYDRENKAVAAIHAGWKGSAAGIVGKTLKFMAEQFGSRGPACHAYLGACISAKAFEVDEDVASRFSAQYKRYDDQRNKFLVDLKSVNAADCLGFGMLPRQIEISPYCTVEDNADFFSHRKEKGLTGRGMVGIGLRG